MSRRWTRNVQEHEAGMSQEQLAHAYAVEKRMERMHRYVVGGRRFASLAEDLLIAQWVETYRFLAVVPDDDNCWDELLTLECEFALRRMERPVHLVETELTRVREHFERVRRGSDRDRAAWEKAQAELPALLARLQQPKH